MKIPLPAVGLVSVGPLGCRTTEWGSDRGVGLMIRWFTGLRTVGRRTNGRRTSIKIPLPDVGPVGLGLLGCRTTEWGQDQGVELMIH